MPNSSQTKLHLLPLEDIICKFIEYCPHMNKVTSMKSSFVVVLPSENCRKFRLERKVQIFQQFFSNCCCRRKLKIPCPRELFLCLMWLKVSFVSVRKKKTCHSKIREQTVGSASCEFALVKDTHTVIKCWRHTRIQFQRNRRWCLCGVSGPRSWIWVAVDGLYLTRHQDKSSVFIPPLSDISGTHLGVKGVQLCMWLQHLGIHPGKKSCTDVVSTNLDHNRYTSFSPDLRTKQK